MQVPVQWASKKLTPTERRYTISEKEMLGVMWGIEKFEYELRGRRFHLITDHRAMEELDVSPILRITELIGGLKRFRSMISVFST